MPWDDYFGISNFLFCEVIRQEDDLLAGGKPIPPHADRDLLRVFSQMKPNSLNLFTAHDLFRVVQGQVSTHFDSLADTGVDRIEALREQYAREFPGGLF